MIGKADIIRILRSMKDECMATPDCGECPVWAACFFTDDRIPAEWTDDEIEEAGND